MSSEYIKQWLAKETNTTSNDWNLIDKRGSGKDEYKQFQNVNDNQTIIVYGERDENNIGYEDSGIDIYDNELVPDGFIIILPDSVKKENVTMDMVLPNTDESFWGDQDGVSLFFTNSKLTNGGMDQHIDHFIENWFDVKNFRKDFNEVSENNLMLVSKLSIQQIIDKLEEKGLKFEGFENLDDF